MPPKTISKSAIQLTETLSIGDIFSLSNTESSDGWKTSLSTEDLADLRKAVPRLVSWSSVQSAVAGSLHGALDVSLLDTLADAWKLYDSLHKDVQQSVKSPRARIVSALAKHEIDSTLHPSIEVLVGTAKVCELVFDVTLATTIKGLLLTLQRGAIVSIELATCTCSGKIAIREIDLLQRDLFTLKLSGELRLKMPIHLTALD